ncbi:hypothetical protein [Flagellimonas marinaquae]|uniref:hypothetical protein n=1 Tax=Flagellimonas marinaquae TaxID=254955 RepID=UPI0020755159|nr:hypothetical protein [Allomuricauda aquimarina]USD24568.1 hypothetical protein MJO53_12890 [Allomuricauda aquimarina]
MNNKLIIKGSLITNGKKWYFGEELYSSVLLSASQSWISNNYSAQGEFLSELEPWKRREFGRIKSSIYAYVSDLHGISINYCLLREVSENNDIDVHKRNLYAEQLLEQYFTVIRSLYDHLTGVIKIILSDKNLKEFPETNSLNRIIRFSKKKTNEDKLPNRIKQFLINVEPDLSDIRIIRDSIIHKGKEILVRRSDKGLFIRIPKKEPFGTDTILPNVLNSNSYEYPLESYLRKITKSFFRNSEDLGVIVLTEMLEREKFNWHLHSITNYCMEDFTKFILEY